jgi:hypothetical protein
MNAKEIATKTSILAAVLWLLSVLSSAGAAEIASVRAISEYGPERADALMGGQPSTSLNTVPCMNGEAEFIASVEGQEFLAPCLFVHETTAHLRQAAAISESSLGFPLGMDHVHLAIPSETWELEYRGRAKKEMLSTILRDPDLIAVYHATAALEYSRTTGTDARSKSEHAHYNRQVLGYYNGRSIEILPDHVNVLTGRYRSVGWFFFRLRQLDGSVASFDISFDRVVADECASADARQIEGGDTVDRKHECV